MTITFFTNFINHHQVPVADEFYKLIGNDYTFVATESMPKRFKDNGFPEFLDKNYLLKAYENDKNKQDAINLGLSSDIVIIGAASEEFIVERLKNNKITFRYSERWVKKGNYQLLFPQNWKYWFNTHIKYRNKSLYMLCASAYASNDAAKIFAYPKKCYKWGYFTEVNEIDLDHILNMKQQKCLKIFWVSRLINLKHPELALKLAFELKKKGYDFHVEMAGNGVLHNEVMKLAKKLEVTDRVSFCGSIPNDQILKKMQDSNVFLFTSDRNEGWGAVLNEAMSNGCTIVASHAVGSVPFLIENKKNGLIFKSENIESLVNQIEILIKDRTLCNQLARNAFKSIIEVWSPQKAASNFLNLAQSLLDGNETIIVEGPCSIAKPTVEKILLKSIN